MISFEPTEDQVLMRDSVAAFAKATLLPRVRETEKLRAVPEDVRQLAHEMGLGLVAVPEACGGQGLGLTTSVLLEEELGAADAAAPFGFPGRTPSARGLELGATIRPAPSSPTCLPRAHRASRRRPARAKLTRLAPASPPWPDPPRRLRDHRASLRHHAGLADRSCLAQSTRPPAGTASCLPRPNDAAG